MRALYRKLVWLLFVKCILCLVRSTHAAIPDYSVSQINTLVRETFFPFQGIERHQLLDISFSKRPSSFILAVDSPALAPAPGFAIPQPAPVPAPVPVPELFPEPGDPPLTVPFIAPSPGPLTIPIPDGPLTPMLSGNCSLNFTAVASITQRTAFDCADPLAAYVGVVICCPQFDSLLRIMQGQHMLTTGALALNNTEAEYCFTDTVNILISLLGNSSVPSLCQVTPSNLTVASCPVTTMAEFELLVNTTLLLEACEVVDPIKECTTQTCQNQIANASLKLAQGISRSVPPQKTVDECESLALSWLASRLTPAQANSVFRTVMSCSVNKVCPLVFSDTSDVAGSCRGSNPSNVTCCKSLDDYLLIMQKQMLITNQQAYRCAANLSRRLLNEGVTADIYSLCDIDLRDFSLQALGTEGCLLPSQPTDVNATAGITFYCDLNDNIAAQWPRPPPANVSSPAPSVLPPPGSSASDVGARTVTFLCSLALSLLVHIVW
ncbi:hypothetical protein MPTK1_1g26730 [Marchantia polymorpha subsp. ruderalis]|uniref:SPARK domain-containing protein n=2 Tax=Marchantia polymorpha TaxID=3197 RepID=A0AAF6AUL7_MARPO|nr:hypothetical protein MARPO_0002s0205 [Marchantia polymorpha]BBN00138.1 hypothetical protein Mp_1g26730 [Marchantia polymorpha subsp. ruderalis]|eukprot:PTQ49746.1 hypothetical protein MARPO_0002s0205 [Marchantia polymorpha]